MNEPKQFWRADVARWARGLTTGAAVGAGLATIIVTAILLANSLQPDGVNWPGRVKPSPLDNDELARMKQSLSASPKNDALRARVRTLDLAARDEHFRTERVGRIGAWMLASLSAAFVTFLRLAFWAGKRVPRPQSGPARRAWPSAWTGAIATLVVAGAVTYLAIAAAATSAPPAPPPPDWPTRQQISRNWPRFRGPGGSGLSQGDGPLAWDAPTGQNILWKTRVPLAGYSSPVVWDNRLFLTGADEHRREVYCFDTGSGKLRWRVDVGDIPGRGRKPEGILEDTGFAACTPATDGKRVAAVFANGDVVCLDATSGKRLWAKHLGTPEVNYGYASSPLIFENLLIVQFDQGMTGDEKGRLLAFDMRTGREVYRRTRRGVGESWTSPIVARTPSGPQLITCSNPWVIAYRPADGAELWRVNCLEGDGAPSPIFDGTHVLAANVGSGISAIRPDGRGDVTQTHVAWTFGENLPDICSPVSNGKLTWMLTTEGLLTCLDTSSGKELWQKDFETKCVASPGLARDRLYIITDTGHLHVLAASSQFRLLAKGNLGEPCRTSPAFVNGRVYLRGVDHLFAIGTKAP